ncbi:MAG: hypothetical protein IT580_11945 [Verrucomicrobiales bacterium]|nr:hypothetical protein [Verrucomicrobiales bacterium]
MKDLPTASKRGWRLLSLVLALAAFVIAPASTSAEVLTDLRGQFLPLGEIQSVAPFPPEPVPIPAGCDCVSTQVSTDVAVLGEGYLLIRQREGSIDRQRLLRTGQFYWDQEGYLLSWSGARVQGFDATGRQRGDVQVPIPRTPEGVWSPMSFYINADGRIWAAPGNGTSNVVARIGLWTPAAPTDVVRLSEEVWINRRVPEGVESPFQPIPDGAVKLAPGFIERVQPGIRVTWVDPADRGAARVSPLRVGLELALTLEGPGFLEVRDPDSGKRYVTRCGMLKWDSDGWLVTALRGYRVQGYASSLARDRADLHRSDPFTSPDPAQPTLALSGGMVRSDGVLGFSWTDGTETYDSRLAFLYFRHPELLVDAGDFFFEMTPESEAWDADPILASGEPRTSIQAGAIDPRFLSRAIREFMERTSSFLQGAHVLVTRAESLALSGKGFFVIRHPVSGELNFTRWGQFKWSAEGYLETGFGWRVQGTLPSHASTLGDVRLPALVEGKGSPQTTFDYEGWLRQHYADGSEVQGARLVLAGIVDPLTLEKVALHQYRVPGGSNNAPGIHWLPPAERSMGSVRASTLELLPTIDWGVPDLAGRRAAQIDLLGIYDRPGLIEVSDNLQTWKPWARYFPSESYWDWRDRWSTEGDSVASNTTIFDLAPEAFQGRFYRLRLVQPGGRVDFSLGQ